MEAQRVESARPLANFPPSAWGDFFLNNNLQWPANIQEHSEEWIKQRIEELVDEVKGILMRLSSSSSDNNKQLVQELKLVDNLERLGISYHFQEEIDATLQRIHDVHVAEDSTPDLYTVALRFRLLRRHGFHAPSDVFNKFANISENKFNASLIGKDIRGLLSLYEAAYLRVPGEVLLDEAIVFARAQLLTMITPSSGEEEEAKGADHDHHHLIKRQVQLALKTPLLKKMSRLETRHYIPIFEELSIVGDVGVDHIPPPHRDILLELAKLDFHALQLLHWEELRHISQYINLIIQSFIDDDDDDDDNFCRWWKSEGIMERYTFARDKIVECFFFMLFVYFEPHYSRARIIASKLVALYTVMDDVYDSYGTYDELLQLDKAFQSWDLAAVDDDHQLDELMKLFFLDLDKLLREFETELSSDGIFHRVDYVKDQIKRVSETYMVETRWRDEGHVPSLSEYLEVAKVSCTAVSLVSTSMVGMGRFVTREMFKWLEALPEIADSLAINIRLMDDLASNEFEQQRTHVVSAVECCMNKVSGGTTKTRERLKEMVEMSWEGMNEGWIQGRREGIIPGAVADVFFNLSRIMELMHKDADTFTHSSTALKDYITLIIVQPID